MKAVASNQTISWFYQRYKEGALILSPDFQRNPVWQQPQKEYLIETILLDMPIPEIYLVNRISLDGSSTWIVVDGQQRLRTILEFVNDALTVQLSIDTYKYIHKFSEISDEEIKKKIWRYPLVIRDLEDSSDYDVRSLFQRLNKYSYALNDQELRNARFVGNFKETIERLGENEFWTISGIFSSNDIRRMSDLEYIGILLSSLIGGIYNRNDRLDEFYTMYDKEFEQQQYYIDQFNKVLEMISLVSPNIGKTIWRNKSNFFALFLVLANLDENRKDFKNLEMIKEKLVAFESEIKQAKIDEATATKDILNYLEAMSYGTNDKEKRIRRVQLLTNYITI
jgi:hypothetical protein